MNLSQFNFISFVVLLFGLIYIRRISYVYIFWDSIYVAQFNFYVLSSSFFSFAVSQYFQSVSWFLFCLLYFFSPLFVCYAKDCLCFLLLCSFLLNVSSNSYFFYGFIQLCNAANKIQNSILEMVVKKRKRKIIHEWRVKEEKNEKSSSAFTLCTNQYEEVV